MKVFIFWGMSDKNQNPWDPAGTFQEIRQALHSKVNWKIVEGIDDTHTYDIDLVLQQLSG